MQDLDSIVTDMKRGRVQQGLDIVCPDGMRYFGFGYRTDMAAHIDQPAVVEDDTLGAEVLEQQRHPMSSALVVVDMPVVGLQAVEAVHMHFVH